MKLPLVSGREVVQALSRIGYYFVRQCGSHICLRHIDRKTVTVPDHHEVAKGTLRRILRDVGISNEDFFELL